MQQLSVRDLAAWLDDTTRPAPFLLDVREAWEVELCGIAGAQHIPMHQIPLVLERIPDDKDIVVICHHGGRSMQVAMFLERQGRSSIHNLMGGVEAWACEVDPTMRRY